MLETSLLSLNLSFTLILIKALVVMFLCCVQQYRLIKGSVLVDCHILFANFTMAERISGLPWYVFLFKQ